MWKKLLILFSIAFILRLVLIPVAMHGDLYNNLSWGNAFVKNGPVNYYERTDWDHSVPNQPPLYILLFGLASFLSINIGNLFNYLNSHIQVFPSTLIWFWQQNGNIILLKLPGIFADLGIGYFIFRFFEEKKRVNLGFKLAALWLFNPVSWYNSAIWGQTDSVVNLLGLIAIYFLIKKKLMPSIVFYVLSILFKGSLVIFLPVIFIYALSQKYSFATWIKTSVCCLVTIVFFSIWFHPAIDLPIWLFNLYTQRFFPGEIGYLTANAFNFWYLVDPGKVLDSVRYFGIGAHIWGYLIATIAILVFIVKLLKDRTEKRLLFFLVLVAFTSFLFMTRIHERYLYPFFPIATILVGLIPEFVVPYMILSFTFLLNMYNLFWAPGIPYLEGILKMAQFTNLLAIINLLVFVFLFVFLQV